MSSSLEPLLERYIQHWLNSGERIPVEELCPNDRPVQEKMRGLIAAFHETENSFTDSQDAHLETANEPVLPEGLVFIEEIGRGSFGRVVKAHDPDLDRVVAVKLVGRLTERQTAGILDEARFLAAVNDPAIPAVYEVADRVIVTEYVEGFDLLKIAPKLDFRQMAAMFAALAAALAKTHARGFVHGDIKPGNIMIDTSLNPKLLDFGLAQFLGEASHRWGTPAYAAPERFHASSKADPRTDLYGLGAVFYEMLTGTPPFQEKDPLRLRRAVLETTTALPRSIRPETPLSLQAIVLQCLEKVPEDRYQSAEMLRQDLQRFLAGAPVLARPRALTADLDQKLAGHLADIRGWCESGLIFPHEERKIARGYRQLRKPLDDWLPENRLVTRDQVVLYLGIAVLYFGALTLFYAHHFLKVTRGWFYPLLIFGGVGLILSWTAARIRRARTVSLAYDLAGLLQIPLLVISLLREFDWFSIKQEPDLALFPSGIFSNGQIQISLMALFFAACFRAWRTRSQAMGTVAVVSGFLLYLALLLNRGWLNWVLEGEYHRVALDLVPLALAFTLNGLFQEKRDRLYLAKPSIVATTVLLVLIPELLALNGKVPAFFGFSSSIPPNAGESFDPLFFDTLTTMTFNGCLFYTIAWLMIRGRSPLFGAQGSLLMAATPFLVLEPLGFLVAEDVYGIFYHWFYAGISLTILWLSEVLQRKSFYYAGIVNFIMALFFITRYYQWLERRFWPVTLIITGGLLLAAGLHLYQRRVPSEEPERAQSKRN